MITGFRDLPEATKKLFEGVYDDRFNYAPAGWRELTEEQFAKSAFFTYSFCAVDFKQLIYDFNGNKLNEKYALSVKLFLMHDGTGFGMYSDYWSGKVRYFAFGCQHVYKEYDKQYAAEHNLPYTYGRCCHNVVCVRCNHVHFYDSSD